jgi:lysophospholipase L1-like esterase
MRPTGTWKWLLVGSLALNVCFGTVAGYVLYRKGGMRYLRNYRAILKGDAVTIDNFPAGYRQQLAQFWAQPITPGRVILAGDSLTENHDWTSTCGASVMNRGISGDTSVGLLFRLGEILRHRPRKLFVLIGISDLRIWRSGAQVLQTYDQLLRRIRAEVPDTQLFVQSVLPINPRMFGSEIDPREVRRINQGLKPLAQKYGATFLDVHSHLVEGEVLDPRLTTEGVHLRPEGYLRWEAVLKQAGCGS